MIGASRTLVIGIGSPHGDDQAGWLLIDRLSAEAFSDAQLRKASTPHNLIDWIDDCDSLHLVDACSTGLSVARLDLSDGGQLASAGKLARCSSSHHVDLVSVIELAGLLDRLPDRIVMWAIPGESFQPAQPISDRCSQYINQCAQLLARELRHA